VVELNAGLRLRPELHLVEPFSSGGMGDVWLARHDGLHVDVLVKFLAPWLSSNEESQQRFLREAAAAARVKSPHVVQVLDQGTIDGMPFMVMELLEGEELGARLRREGRLPLSTVRTIVEHVGRALEAAHARAIIHRDIKPGNIFCCSQGSGPEIFKVLDFGLAKFSLDADAEHLTESGAVMGTPAYMSPEQLVGAKELDARTDLWSLAVVAYRALTGQAPWNASTAGAIALAMNAAPPEPPTSIDPSLPEAVDAWFERALARNIDERFASATAMREAFDEVCQDRRPPAGAGLSRETSETLTAPPVTRASHLRFAVSAAGVVGAAGVVVALWALRGSVATKEPVITSASPSALATLAEPPPRLQANEVAARASGSVPPMPASAPASASSSLRRRPQAPPARSVKPVPAATESEIR
jgi:serine/threonine-protein kinase